MAESESLEGLDMPLYEKGRYNNPWETWTGLSYLKLLQFVGEKNLSNIPRKEDELNRTLPVMKPDLSEFNQSPSSGVRFMWIGHASCLVQFDGLTILTDPVFSERCSISQWFGPKRYRPPPCSVNELPTIDATVISHNHYDHLDYGTVKALNKRFGENMRWYVPQDMKKWFTDNGCKNVVQLTWWQEHLHSEQSGVRFVATPAQHWCKRTATDTCKALWCSWTIIGPKHRFHFSGDTGYCTGFQQIGKRYGPFTLAAIPIGAYQPRKILKPQHVNPIEAVDIHTDIKSLTSVGIHWGTFPLSFEPYLEPRSMLQEEVKNRALDPLSFVTVNHGQVHIFGLDESK